MPTIDRFAKSRAAAGVATVGLAVLVSFLGLASAQVPARKADEPAKAAEASVGLEDGVRKLVEAFNKGYNSGDANALTALFADDAAIIDSEGAEIRGRDQLSIHYKSAFAEGPTTKISGELESIRFPTPDVGSASGRFALVDAHGDVLVSGRFSLIAVRKGDGWKIAELQDQSVKATGPAESQAQIQKLAWMVGDWVDEGPDIEVRTSVRWAEDEHFLVRTYSLRIGGEPARSGTQWIGWDSQSEQIKSWVFDSQGGHGEGLWTESEGRWIVKAMGVLGDGRSSSATQIIEPVNKDSIRFRSIDRIVGEEVQPDLGEVILVRRPPGPATTTAPPATGAAPRTETP